MSDWIRWGYLMPGSPIASRPPRKSRPPGPTGLPQHLQINFGACDPKDVKPGDLIIYVIPVAEYQKVWNDKNDPSVSNTLQKLSTLLEDKPEPIDASGMPILPYVRGELGPGPNFTRQCDILTDVRQLTGLTAC